MVRAMADAGHKVSKDSVARHCNRDLAPPDPEEDLTGDPVGLLVAIAARDVLVPWPSLARRLAERLLEDGAEAAASIVATSMSSIGERPLPPAAIGTDVRWRLESEMLASALGKVFANNYPDVSREIAADLHDRGATELSDRLMELASSAERAIRARAALHVTRIEAQQPVRSSLDLVGTAPVSEQSTHRVQPAASHAQRSTSAQQVTVIAPNDSAEPVAIPRFAGSADLTKENTGP
jgi:hypothetical protein